MNEHGLAPQRAPHRRNEDSSENRLSQDEVSTVSALAVHGDPSRPEKRRAEQEVGRPQRGVAWVRPSDLLTQAGGRVAGRGIDFQAELARRTRHLPTQALATSRRAVSKHAHRLPPVTAFGKRSSSRSGATHSGIGLG